MTEKCNNITRGNTSKIKKELEKVLKRQEGSQGRHVEHI